MKGTHILESGRVGWSHPWSQVALSIGGEVVGSQLQPLRDVVQGPYPTSTLQACLCGSAPTCIDSPFSARSVHVLHMPPFVPALQHCGGCHRDCCA
jgi:hypothetical protein